VSIEPTKDKPGPNHSPIFSDTKIEGVVVMNSPFVEYLGDNLLTELYRPEWAGVFAAGEPIEHLYTVKAPSGGTRTEWYYHEETIDRYLILSGQLDMGLFDGRPESRTYGIFEVISLQEPGGILPNAVRIPPLVWHSLSWKSSQGMFMTAKIPGFQTKSPDKFRVRREDLPDAIDWPE
jgi:dTDP-4-dehydrorhamnose 3,5-epimerase